MIYPSFLQTHSSTSTLILVSKQNLPHLIPPLNVEVCGVEVGGEEVYGTPNVTSTRPTRRLEPEMEEEEPKQSHPITRQMDSEIEKSQGTILEPVSGNGAGRKTKSRSGDASKSGQGASPPSN